jgi:succinyl-diaminopimelate desuccinylase
VRSLLRIYEEYTGEAGSCLSIGGQTYVHGIPGGVAFGCAFPGVDCRIHGANEYIGVDELILSAKMFTQAIIDIAASPE